MNNKINMMRHFEPNKSPRDGKMWTLLLKKFKMSESAGKMIATMIWNCERIVLIDFKKREGGHQGKTWRII